MIKVKVNNEYKDVVKIFGGGTLQKEIIKVWSREAQEYVYESSVEYTGTLPITINANGDALLDYRIYGADGGVGESADITGLSEPLCGIQTYTDSLDLSTGILTRRIKKLVLTGNEGISRSFYYSNSFAYNNPEISTAITRVFSTHFEGSDSVPTGTQRQKKVFAATAAGYIYNSILFGDWQFSGNANAFNAWLAQQYAAGTPVTVWYVLENPDVSTISIPPALTGTIEGYLIQDGTPTPETPIYPTANGVKQANGTYSIEYDYAYKLPMVTTKNLFDPDGTYEANKFKDNNGNIASYNNSGYYTQYMPINSEELISVKNARGNYDLTIRLYYYDSQKNWIGRSGGNGHVTDFTETPLAGAAFIQLQLGVPYTANADKIIISQGGTTTPVYIGENQLDAGEYVSYSDGKIYRMVNGTLTPTDPPVPLPDIPTIKGETVIDYDGEPKPSQVYIKYRR